jgi:hypothetical protein
MRSILFVAALVMAVFLVCSNVGAVPSSRRLDFFATRSQEGEKTSHTAMSPGDFALLMRLFVLAFRQGASVSRCLIHVSEAMGSQSSARALIKVGRCLERGTEWEFAWSLADDVEAGDHVFIVRLREALEPSWRRGMSPVGRLESLSAAIMEEEESAVEITAAKLSVRLLLPTGLCFLPAFILVGVLPSVVAFAGG